MSTNVYAKFRCAALRIKKAFGIFRELIKTRTRTTRVAFWTRLPGMCSFYTEYVACLVKLATVEILI